ncbi:hypothetical protein LSTR_LSTR006138 [Laodelphax striatellus]|uniref:LanC-like protein 2 n=1 Tax=Laodelphax striatellus TaxID=195883 RepID=A0A482WYG9_LAOST|nr:hypothetical protein LSTR_LSTR006138 [Laodelphax striatellus]
MSGSQKPFTNDYEDYSGNDLKGDKIEPDVLTKQETKITELINLILRSTKLKSTGGDVSVYTGKAGIALTLFMIHNKLGVGHYREEAIQYIDDCLKNASKRRHSFLNGDAGVYAVGAFIYNTTRHTYAMGLLEKLTAKHEEVCKSSDIPDEILYGRAGYLYALLFVKKYTNLNVEDSIIRKVISAILDSGKKLADKNGSGVPLEFEWHDKNYLGGAHGIAGILYLLLLAKHYLTEDELLWLGKPSINYLLSFQYPSGNFPSSIGSKSSDRLVQWCHGAPGVVQLMSKAYEVFGDEKYLQSALKCGEVVWQRGLLWKGYSLCHGVAGNGYTFIQLYQLTRDKKHLHRAIKFGEWCTTWPQNQFYPPDRGYSLFEGIAGIAYFLADLITPDTAAFPAYSL